MEKQKELLIKSLKRKGFSEKILGAFTKVPRENFVPEEQRRFAYEDAPLLIGYDQTISQPFTIAFMLYLLQLDKRKQRILEIGSGSGYVLALMSEITNAEKTGTTIYGVERVEELADRSKRVLNSLGYKNIKVICADGSKGLPKKAPFNRILISASAKDIPYQLAEQLKIEGILVSPVRNSIIKLKKTKKGNEIEEYKGFVFVPLVGG